MICGLHDYGLSHKLIGHSIVSRLDSEKKKICFWDENEHGSIQQHAHNFQKEKTQRCLKY